MSRQAAVIRSKTFKLAWEVFYKNPQFHPISFNDRIFAFIAAVEGNAKTLPVVHQIRHYFEGGSISDKEELAEELGRDIQMVECLDEHHLAPVVNLLVEKENKDVSFEHALQYSIKLLKDQCESAGDACCVDTSNWDYAAQPPWKRNPEQMEEIEYIHKLFCEPTKDE